MKKVLPFLFVGALVMACGSSGQRVVKPKTHKVWARGNRYLIDIPIGARHIHLVERKRTKLVRMK
ncbi:MAG: hypothetical protein JNJ65_11410 [Cyclobacteriaceae bacterium]|jgi:hypothetical protein|nr:hypothetical protein [Cyclobacteriaceae bacterium]